MTEFGVRVRYGGRCPPLPFPGGGKHPGGGCLTFDRCTVLLQKEFAFNQLYSAVTMELYTELILIQFIHCVNGDGSKTAKKSLKR